MNFLSKLQNQGNNDSWQLCNTQFQIKNAKVHDKGQIIASKDENLIKCFPCFFDSKSPQNLFAFYNKCD